MSEGASDKNVWRTILRSIRLYNVNVWSFVSDKNVWSFVLTKYFWRQLQTTSDKRAWAAKLINDLARLGFLHVPACVGYLAKTFMCLSSEKKWTNHPLDSCFSHAQIKNKCPVVDRSKGRDDDIELDCSYIAYIVSLTMSTYLPLDTRRW
jgi:hypothetical protein